MRRRVWRIMSFRPRNRGICAGQRRTTEIKSRNGWDLGLRKGNSYENSEMVLSEMREPNQLRASLVLLVVVVVHVYIDGTVNVG